MDKTFKVPWLTITDLSITANKLWNYDANMTYWQQTTYFYSMSGSWYQPSMIISNNYIVNSMIQDNTIRVEKINLNPDGLYNNTYF